MEQSSWVPKVGGAFPYDNSWPTNTRLKAGITPVDFNNLSGTSGLNQIVGECNRQGSVLGLTTLPYISLLTKKVDKAYLAALVANVNAINTSLGLGRPSATLGTYITRSLIKQLRDCLNDTIWPIAFTGGGSISRTYDSFGQVPPLNPGSYSESVGAGLGGAGFDGVYAGVYAQRGSYRFTVPATGSKNVYANYQTSGAFENLPVGGSVTTFVPYTVSLLTGSPPLIWDMTGGQVIGSFTDSQTAFGDTPTRLISLGSLSPGDYTLCVSYDNDVAYCMASGNGSAGIINNGGFLTMYFVA